MALLLYCYSHGIFSSRRIERASWKDVAVRYICGNLHPDHDTICAFRVGNQRAISEAFLQVLLLAKEMNVLKVGTVSVDGTKIKANASISKSIRYDRAGELEGQLKLEIAELMNRAAESESAPADEGETLGKEIQRLEELRTKMTKARQELEERAKAKAEKEKAAYDDKQKRRQARKNREKGRIIEPPKETPEPGDQSRGLRSMPPERPREPDHEKEQPLQLRSGLQRPGGSGRGWDDVGSGGASLQPGHRRRRAGFGY